MADGDVFDRTVVLIFDLIRDTLWRIACPFRLELRRLLLNCGLYIKRPDREMGYSEPVLIRCRKTRNGLALYLKLPPGMAPQDFDKARDKLGFALGGAVSCRATSVPRVIELVVTSGSTS